MTSFAFEQELGRLRALVGEEAWPAFRAWADHLYSRGPSAMAGPGAPRAPWNLSPAALDREAASEAYRRYVRARRWAEAAAQLHAGTAERLREGFAELGLQGGALGDFASAAMLDRRLEEIARVSTSEADTITQVRGALGRLLPSDPLLDGWADVLAEKIGRSLWQSPRVSGGRAAAVSAERASEAVRAAQRDVRAGADAMIRGIEHAARGRLGAIRQQARADIAGLDIEHAAMQARLQEVKPRLVPPEARGRRDLEGWERQLWIDFRQITAGLNEEDTILAAFAALRHSPELPRTLGLLYDQLSTAYPRVMGRRLGDVPAELAPVVEELSSIVQSYEALFVKHGFDFVKDPRAMMKDWGVVQYVPHLASREQLGMSSGQIAAAATGVTSGPGGYSGSLDERFGMGMDAARRRTLEGTVGELNAAIQSETGAARFTMDPALLLARYIQANKAISAQEFLLAMLRGGVLRPISGDATRNATRVAHDLDYVPLFRAPDVTIDYNLLASGDINAFGGLSDDEVVRLVEKVSAWSRGEGKGVESMFAGWLSEAPVMQQAANVEEVLFRLRAAELRRVRSAGGVTLTPFDPLAKQAAYVTAGLDDAKAWEKVAADMVDELNRLGASAPLRSPLGEHLAAYFEGDEAIWKLYIPRTVAQSMRDLFELERELGGGMGKALLDRINSFFKVRLTVMSIAFTARNALSNVFTNILDLGPLGALNPLTNLRAMRIANALPFADAYGSLAKAQEVLSAPRGQYESILEFNARRAKYLLFRSTGVEQLAKDGIDLGDGVVQLADDAIRLLKGHGVVSGAFTQVSDIGRLETGLAEVMSAGGLGSRTDRILHGASVAEDVLLIGLSTALSGGLPVTVGKTYGAELARFVENQARLCNFMGNFRQHGDWRLAADHVAKFLFDYGDLTAIQRTWMRTIIPFFTWTQKNVSLQLDMRARSPAFYAAFQRTMLFGFPKLVEASDANAEARQAMYWDPSSQARLRLRQKHTLAYVRLPIPKSMAGFRGAYFEGLGLPQEAFVEQTAMLANLLNPDNYRQEARYWEEKPMLRFLAQSHFMAKLMFEAMSQHHTFYDRPIDKLTNGGLIDQTGNAMRRFPLVGEYGAAALEFGTGLHRILAFNKHTGDLEPLPVVYGQPNWVFANLPWTRVLRDASAATDLHRLSLAADIAEEQAAGRDDYALPALARYIDALTGLRLMQEDEAQRQRVYDARLREASRQQTEARAIVSTGEIPTIRSR